MMHPSMSRVNSEQCALTPCRPPPPCTPPPPQPQKNNNEVSDTLKTTRLSTPPPWRPTPLRAHTLDDELSTVLGSSDGGESASDCEHEETVVAREVMLYHRSLCLRTATKAIPGQGLHCVADAKLSCKPDFAPPPGLSLAQQPAKAVLCNVAPPPGLELVSRGANVVSTYSPPAFRKELMAIFKDLAVDHNVARAVRRVRQQAVPRDRQSAEVADAVTYALEEPRGATRRIFVAFVTGLAAAFERSQCAAGLELFFRTVYPDLQEEVPKLHKLVNIEFLPTLRSVYSAKEMKSFLPAELAVPALKT